MSLPAVFNRKVCNATGIDITVPCHQEVEGPLGGTSVEYIVNTVLRLKVISEDCNEDEVSEYKTSKSFRECEDFYTKLHRQYPSVPLPELPSSSKKPPASLDERRKAVDEFVKCVASTNVVCTCQLLLKFLGIDPSEKPKAPVPAPVPNNAIEPELGSAVFEKVKLKQDIVDEKVKLKQDIVDSSANKKIEPKSLFSDVVQVTPAAEEEEEEDDSDIFRESRKRNTTGSKPLFDQLSLDTRNEKLINREPLLFDPQDYGGPLSPEDEHLFLVTGAKRDISLDISVDSLEETTDLLSLDDNLDDFLQQFNQKKKKPAPSNQETSPLLPENQPLQAKPATPAKPAVALKPVLPVKPTLAPKPMPAARGVSNSPSSKPVAAERPVPKPRKRTTPPVAKPTAAQEGSDLVKKSEENADGDIDILKYIEQEEKAGQTDISLFS